MKWWVTADALVYAHRKSCLLCIFMAILCIGSFFPWSISWRLPTVNLVMGRTFYSKFREIHAFSLHWLYSEKAYKHRECNMFYVCVCYFGVLGGFWPSTASQFLTVVLENGFAWLVLCVYTDTGLAEIFLFCTFTYSCGLLYVTDSIAQIILIDCWTEAAVCSRRKRPKRRYVPNCLR